MIHPGESDVATVRAVFIISPNGIVRAVLYYPLTVGRNTEEILRLLKALQVSLNERVAIPANWPKNKLIGDRVIVPPPSEIQVHKNV